VLVAMAWGYTQVFTGRAALLHLGAFTATIMSANVAMIIIPNQKIVVADLKAGRTPDPKYGRIAKQRSLHNNYLTLPVIFLMLSNHYPLAFATQWNWLIAALVFLMGVTIRHWFNTVHARKGKPHWTWAATVALFLAVIWLSSLPRGDEVIEEASLAPVHQRFIDNAHFEGQRDGHGTVLDVPCGGAVLGRHCPRTQECEARHRGRHCPACKRDLSAGRAQPCDAAGQHHLYRARGAPPDRGMV
jgi:uncharacterized membrane protein